MTAARLSATRELHFRHAGPEPVSIFLSSQIAPLLGPRFKAGVTKEERGGVSLGAIGEVVS